MAATKTLQAVGYWYSEPWLRMPRNERFPDPRLLVQKGWHAADRMLILAYLRSGWTFARWRGLSYCRFECGVDDSNMGSRCLTDGIWVWPEGLSHYIDSHNVYLPAEFIQTMHSRGWKVLEQKEPPDRQTHGEPDDSFWIEWAAKQAAKGSA